MAGINLQANEMVLDKHEQLMRRVSSFATENGDFLLTNLYLTWVSKNVFGNIKNVQQIPLNSIKINNGKAQVMVNKVGVESPKLTIFYLSGQETFEFVGKSEDDLKVMANAINKAITKKDEDLYEVKSYTIIGAALAAEVLKDTVNVFKDAFGVKGNKQNTPINERVAKKCIACGAPISGQKGQVISCEYCDSDQQI